MTTDNSRADALTKALNDALYVLQHAEYPPEMDGKVREARAALTIPIEQHEAAPAEKEFRSIEEWEAEYLPKGIPENPEDLTPQLAPSAPLEATPALSRQDIFDKFSFLEGLVSQSTYVSIAETAASIYESASKAAPLEGTGNGADERAAFVKLIGYDRPDAEGVAQDAWDSQRSTWLEALDYARAPRTEVAGAVPAYAVFRTRWDENEGREFFYVAHWHNDYLPQEGERIVAGYFVPSADAAAAPADEPSELEQVVACLGDDAATLRHSDEYVEMADNMEAAARLLESLAEDRAADEMCNRWPWQREASQPTAAAGQEAVAYTHPDRLGRLASGKVQCETLWSKDLLDDGDIPLYTAPPAQVATRQLTDEQRKSIWWAVLTAEADEPTPGSLMHRRAQDLRAILATQQPEPRDEVTGWQTIETAPKETELLGWRKDCGVLLIMHTSFDRWASEAECDEIDEETLFQKDWFGTALPGIMDRLEGGEAPTHWMAIPAAPSDAARAGGAS